MYKYLRNVSPSGTFRRLSVPQSERGKEDLSWFEP